MNELNKVELRSLAEAAMPGDWFKAGNLLCFDVKTGESHGLNVEDDRFIASASPAAVLSLLDQCDGLMVQHARDSATLRELCQARDDAKKERDAALAELEACRKDAERYQWLRDQHDVLSGKCWVATHQKGSWVSLDSAVLGVEREIELDLDSAVDAAMAKESRQ
jgi:hypothetical protein